MNLICGMHRSGTSLIARLAALSGADFGNHDDFHPADRWNPAGYFEQADILAANIRLVNGLWGKFSYFRLPSTTTVCERAQRLQGRLTALQAKYGDCTVKENRFCLTLPAWRASGAQFTRVLVVYREPLAVARSLAKRNRIPWSLALLLWDQHYERLLAAVADLSYAVISYDRLIATTESATDQLAKLQWLTALDTDTLQRLATDAIRYRDREFEALVHDYPPTIRQRWWQLEALQLSTP